MDSQIKKLFLLQIALFIILIFLISVFTMAAIANRSIEEAVLDRFEYELSLVTNQFNTNVSMATENVKALSSRTMIKNELYRYHRQEISLPDLQEYASPKYIEGASVYDNILYAQRTDSKGRIVSHFQTTSPGDELSDGKDIVFFKTDAGCNIFIRNPIVQGHTIIGYDNAAFLLCNFKELNTKYLANAVVSSAEVRNLESKPFSLSKPIGDTGYFLYADLKDGVMFAEKKAQFIPISLQALILIIMVLTVSYFTILKLLRKVIRQLTEAQARAAHQERYYAIGQITGGVAHEFNNILTGVLGYTEILKKSAETSERSKEILEKVIGAVYRAAKIVDQLLTYGRKNVIEKKKLSIRKLFKKLAEEQPEQVQIELPPGQEVLYDLDEQVILQALNNLITNALNAHASVIKVKCREKEFSGRAQ